MAAVDRGQTEKGYDKRHPPRKIVFTSKQGAEYLDKLKRKAQRIHDHELAIPLKGAG